MIYAYIIVWIEQVMMNEDLIILSVYYKMRSKKKSEKKANSKSLEKRSTSRKQDIKLFLDA